MSNRFRRILPKRGFNPCCSGTWSIIRRSPPLSDRRDVSILVVLELGRSFRDRGAKTCDRRIGFNPCCSGTWSIIGRNGRSRFARVSFNPCCSGTWSIITSRSLTLPFSYPVSILVVLELGRSSASRIDACQPFLCFNPCCSGTWSIIRPGLIVKADEMKFQSLLFWNLVDHRHHFGVAGLRSQFQSLLFWNLVDHGEGRNCRFLSLSGFQSLLFWNLVDHRPRRARRGEMHREFQSLLFWNLVDHNSWGPFWAEVKPCFNPCCSGTWSIIDSTRLDSTDTFGFQSLLFWNLVDHTQRDRVPAASNGFNPCCSGTWSIIRRFRSRSRSGREFQSLLFWNLVDHDRGDRDGGKGIVSFNPCCSGTWSIIRSNRWGSLSN